VSCMYDTCGAPVDINGVAIARFSGGAMASLCIGGNCQAFSSDIRIQTDRLLIKTDQYGGSLEMTTGHNEKLFPHVEALGSTPGAGTPVGNMVAAIRGEEPLRVPVRYGVLLSALMDAMYESADRKAPVTVKPVPETLA